MESLKNLLNLASLGQVTAFQDAVNDELDSRIVDRIDELRFSSDAETDPEDDEYFEDDSEDLYDDDDFPEFDDEDVEVDDDTEE